MEKNQDIYALLDELQEEIDLSPSRGFSKNKSIDPKIVSEIIGDIRAALDGELEHAKRVMRDRDQILNAAKTQADEILKEARKNAQELVSENAVTYAAYEKASKLLENAKQKSGEMRKSATTYAEEVFDDLESYYSECIEMIRENRSRLYVKSEPKETV